MLTLHLNVVSETVGQPRHRDRIIVNEDPDLLVDAATFDHVMRFSQVRVRELERNDKSNRVVIEYT